MPIRKGLLPYQGHQQCGETKPFPFILVEYLAATFKTSKPEILPSVSSFNLYYSNCFTQACKAYHRIPDSFIGSPGEDSPHAPAWPWG